MLAGSAFTYEVQRERSTELEFYAVLCTTRAEINQCSALVGKKVLPACIIYLREKVTLVPPKPTTIHWEIGYTNKVLKRHKQSAKKQLPLFAFAFQSALQATNHS